MFEVSRRPLNTQSSQCDEIIYYEQSFDVATLNTHTRCRLLTWLKDGGGGGAALNYLMCWAGGYDGAASCVTAGGLRGNLFLRFILRYACLQV